MLVFAKWLLFQPRKRGYAGTPTLQCRREGVTSAQLKGGFSLIELMVALSIAAVLLAVAIPSFKEITISSKLTTTANDFIRAISIARMEAIKRNSKTQLCSDSAANNTSDTLGAACGTAAGAVFGMAGATATQIQAGTVGLGSPIKLNGAMTAVRFAGSGLGQAIGSTAPYTGLVADICTGQTAVNNHRLINMTTGSIIVTTTTSGACP